MYLVKICDNLYIWKRHIDQFIKASDQVEAIPQGTICKVVNKELGQSLQQILKVDSIPVIPLEPNLNKTSSG